MRGVSSQRSIRHQIGEAVGQGTSIDGRTTSALQTFQSRAQNPDLARGDDDLPRLDVRALAEDAKLRRLRARLSDVLGIQSPGQDAYRFHVTLAYLYRWLRPEEERAFRAALAIWRRRLAKACPVIALGAPEYCLLEDMFAFKRQFYVGRA